MKQGVVGYAREPRLYALEVKELSGSMAQAVDPTIMLEAVALEDPWI
jgi:hypothetical protein